MLHNVTIKGLSLLFLIVLFCPVSLAGAHPGYQLIKFEELDIAFEIRADWRMEILPGDNLLITGQAESDAAEIMAILQVLDKQTNQTSLTRELNGFRQQIHALPQGQIKTELITNIAGLAAPYLEGSYKQPDENNKLTLYHFVQWGLDKGDMLYLLGYSAPENIYMKYADDLKHLRKSFRFTAPN